MKNNNGQNITTNIGVVHRASSITAKGSASLYEKCQKKNQYRAKSEMQSQPRPDAFRQTRTPAPCNVSATVETGVILAAKSSKIAF